MTQDEAGAQTGEILIIDDDEDARHALIDILEARGHDCSEAVDGRIGLLSIKNFSPDLVIIDANLPHMDGITVLSRIRATPDTANLPVLIVTDSPSMKEQQRAVRFSAVDYMQKPVGEGDLMERVNWALSADDPTDSPYLSVSRSADSSDSEESEDPAEENESGLPAIAASEPAAEKEPAKPVVERPQLAVGPAAAPARENNSGPESESSREAVGIAESLQAQLAKVETLDPKDAQNLEYGKDERLMRLQQYDREAGRWVEVATYVEPISRSLPKAANRELPAKAEKLRGRILVIEPNEQEFQKVIASLDGTGFQIVREDRLPRAHARIAREQPSMVILGLSIAGPPGIRLLREIRSDAVLRSVVVIPIVRPQDRGVYPEAASNEQSAVFGPVHLGGLHHRVTRAFAVASVQRRRSALVRGESRRRRPPARPQNGRLRPTEGSQRARAPKDERAAA